MNEVSDIVLFFGRFHPLLVHLPIGFLFFAFIVELNSHWKKKPVLLSVIPLALFLGAISALLASILGYMLSLSDEYDVNAVDTHFWFGVVTTIVTFLAWLIRSDKIKIPTINKLKPNIAMLTLIVILVSITGHYGGNLTHGSDYLVKYLPFGKSKAEILEPVASIEEAEIFKHMVNPILQQKCANCHNPKKKKGGLSFQDSITILKGGKNGAVFVAGSALESEMIRRIFLDAEHDDVMPPDGKTPLTDSEKQILDYWIENVNADFNAKFTSMETSVEMLDIALSFLGLDGALKQDNLPTASKIDKNILDAIIGSGFMVRELVSESNLIDVSLPANTKGLNQQKITNMLKQLLKVKQHILWLSLPSNGIADEHLNIIAKFENLKKLRLEKNPITDAGIAYLAKLQHLESLNVYQTKITNISIGVLSEMENLKKVYAWDTDIKTEHISTDSVSNKLPQFLLGN